MSKTVPPMRHRRYPLATERIAVFPLSLSPTMIQRTLLLSSLLALIISPTFAQVAAPIDETVTSQSERAALPAALQARQAVPANIYYSPSGLFSMPIPVLPELGGNISDSKNYVIFSDPISTHITVGVIEMDASARFERSTMTTAEFLRGTFEKMVLPQFLTTSPATRTDTVLLLPKIEAGTLYVGSIHPGTSQFIGRTSLLGDNYDKAPTARRGTLLFAKGDYFVIISSELAEKATERSAFKLTPEQENELIRERLLAILHRIRFTIPQTSPAVAK